MNTRTPKSAVTLVITRESFFNVKSRCIVLIVMLVRMSLKILSTLQNNIHNKYHHLSSKVILGLTKPITKSSPRLPALLLGHVQGCNRLPQQHTSYRHPFRSSSQSPLVTYSQQQSLWPIISTVDNMKLMSTYRSR